MKKLVRTYALQLPPLLKAAVAETSGAEGTDSNLEPRVSVLTTTSTVTDFH